MKDIAELIFTWFIQMPLWAKVFTLAWIAVTLLFMSLRFVHEGERGLKLRFGRVVRDKAGTPITIEPGFTFLIPKAETLVKRHVRQQTITLDNQEILLKDNSIFIVSAVVFFRVEDIYRALFEIDELDLAVRNFCMETLRSVLQGIEETDGIKDIEGISKKLEQAAESRIQEWGIKLVKFGLVNCAPSRETASFITALPAVRARVEALRSQRISDPMMAAALLGAGTINTLGESSRQQSLREIVASRRVVDGESDHTAAAIQLRPTG
jgi:regulator of protease activity HflC (stomatin/prohibitin superfamily)